MYAITSEAKIFFQKFASLFHRSILESALLNFSFLKTSWFLLLRLFRPVWNARKNICDELTPCFLAKFSWKIVLLSFEFFFARKSWTSFHLCCFFDVFFWQDVKTWKIRDYFRFLRKISNCTVKVIHIESTKCKIKRYYIICKIEFWVKKIQMLSILHSLNGKMH